MPWMRNHSDLLQEEPAAVTGPTQPPLSVSRMRWAWRVLTVLLFVLGIGVIFLFDGWIATLIGSLLLVSSVALGFYLIPPTELPVAVGADHGFGIPDVLAAHAEELADVPGGDRRGEIVTTWRGTIDQQAHAYADLVLSHPRRDELVALEVEAIMQAYRIGYAGGQGWISEDAARQSAFVLGRTLRGQIRRLGIKLEDVEITIGVVIDDALLGITKRGIADGRTANSV